MGGPQRPAMLDGSLVDYVTFNSITDNAKLGDERNFVRIRQSGVGEYVNEAQLQAGTRYEVMTYFHNDANSRFNDSGEGIAKDVSISVRAPSVVQPGERGMVSSIIFCSNAEPLEVWDEAYVTSEAAVELRYVSGSARITSHGPVNGQSLPNSIFTTLALLGYDRLDGIVPAGAQHSGFIIYELEARAATSLPQHEVDPNDDLVVPHQKAIALFREKDYAGAYSAFTALRKLRARREGTGSKMYLSNTKSAITCLRLLNRYDDVLPLAKELSQASDMALGPTHADSILAKIWWASSAQRAHDATTVAGLHIELADAYYTKGDNLSAEQAMATAVYFENKVLNGSGDATQEVAEKADSTQNGEKLKNIAKRVGVGALATGATAAIEAAVGQFFN